ncbi:MAG TPA: FtsX-like permease family protein [Gemmatimonadaceae bacterium]|nr:FtsX-like permease family protein [Gemmatimonadaceae bacterium]
MRTLDLKLLRELRRHWVQVASIALVMGCGTMTIMGLRSTLTSIRAARDSYFDTYRFGDVFARLQRTPSAVAGRIATIDGVAATQTRIVRDVKLDVPRLSEPAIGHMVSVPETQRPMLNQLKIRRGRWIAPGRDDEVIVSERFAELNRLAPGDSLAAVVNGRWQRLHIVGVAISPEFVVEFAGGGFFVDNRRYGILWTSAQTLETAFDMKGAFNDVVVRLAPGADERAVIGDLDRLLRPWGSAGAHGRRDQPAARALADEFTQLRVNATVFPMFFLIVAAFLLNVVLSRLVASQRDEIAALKAFGYTDWEIGSHYLGFGIAAVAVGAALGIPAGIWMGAKFTNLYRDYFRFPSLPSLIDWGAATFAVGVSGGFALLGALSGVRRVMKLPPAEALRPDSPARFRPLLIEHLGLGRFVSSTMRMILRNLERRPVRTGATVVGIALAVALLASGRFPYDAFDRLLEVEFHLAQRYDAVATFTDTRPARAARELEHVDGVLSAVPFRATPVRITRGVVSRTTSITGLEPDDDLYRLVDVDGNEFDVPARGCILGLQLARVLGVRAGDTIVVELLELGDETRSVVVAGLFDPMLGEGLYMSRRSLNALLREQDAANGAHLSIAPGREDAVFARLKDFPAVAGAASRAATIRNIDEQIRQSMTFVLMLITVSACIIAIGVVYNSARIALSERGRELASLRVLGFTSNEVAGMLLGEQLAVLIVALPAGVGFGALFSYALSRGFETERFHFPYVIALDSQIFAMSIVVAAAVLASVIVRRRVGRLDMVSALRTRE